MYRKGNGRRNYTRPMLKKQYRSNTIVGSSDTGVQSMEVAVTRTQVRGALVNKEDGEWSVCRRRRCVFMELLVRMPACSSPDTDAHVINVRDFCLITRLAQFPHLTAAASPRNFEPRCLALSPRVKKAYARNTARTGSMGRRRIHIAVPMVLSTA